VVAAKPSAYGVRMLVDLTAASRRPAPERIREWLAEQRLFISSAMADTAAERRAVAGAAKEMGTGVAWFEEFGRDADAEEAYTAEVDGSSIYIAILNEQYGRLNSPEGFSATEIEYMRAREGGKRVNVYVATNAPGREGHLSRFIDRVRFFVTTENYADAADLAARVCRRLEDLGAEALSPWVKLGELVFRAEEIVDAGDTITLRGRSSDEIAHRLEDLRDQRFGRPRLSLVSRGRVAEGDLQAVKHTTQATGADQLTIEIGNVETARVDSMRAGTSGHSVDDLTEFGMRALFLGEPLPRELGMLDFMAETGIDVDDLRQAFELPNEVASAIAQLVVAEGLVGSGRANRVTSFSLGPREGDVRRVAVSWDEPRVYTNTEPRQRTIDGDWRRPG
jgi:hypothetical protein